MHYPRYDPDSMDGKRAFSPLANGLFGVLWGIIGDLEYLQCAGVAQVEYRQGPLCSLQVYRQRPEHMEELRGPF